MAAGPRLRVPARSTSKHAAAISADSCGAAPLILVHHHPSGDPTPSKADIAVTHDIKKAAAALGVVLHDHLIIGRNGHISLRELGEI